MNENILAKKIKSKSTVYFLLSIPFIIIGTVLIISLAGCGLFSMDGYLKPYDLQSSIHNLDGIADNPLGYETFTISLNASADDLVDTGIELYVDNVLKSHYLAVYLDGKYVLCRIDAAIYDAWQEGQGYNFTGTLAELEPDVVAMVIEDMGKDNISETDARKMLYPYFINTDSNGFVLRSFEYIILLAICFLGVYFFIRGLGPILNIQNHPAVRRLSQYGAIDLLLAEIEQQFAATADINSYPVRRMNNVVYLLSGWVVIDSLLNIKLQKAEDLLWAYKMKQTTRYLGVIPLNVNYCLKLNFRSSVMALPGKESLIDELLNAISEKYAWAVVGFSDELEAMWNCNIDQFARANAKNAETRPMNTAVADEGSYDINEPDRKDTTMPL